MHTLLATPEIDTIVVDTDSPVITDDLKASFPSVQILARPAHLRADTVPMNEVLLHDTAQVAADFYLQTHSTNPLLKPETISRAVNTFLGNYPTFDSLFSVTRLQTRLWDQLGRPVPSMLTKAGPFPPVGDAA
jgi:CMP-N-acetylneuraminic acid synthetase